MLLCRGDLALVSSPHLPTVLPSTPLPTQYSPPLLTKPTYSTPLHSSPHLPTVPPPLLSLHSTPLHPSPHLPTVLPSTPQSLKALSSIHSHGCASLLILYFPLLLTVTCIQASYQQGGQLRAVFNLSRLQGRKHSFSEICGKVETSFW